MRKKSASGVLTSLRDSTYGTMYDSPLCSLRPYWTAFANPAWLFSVVSNLDMREGYRGRNKFFRILLEQRINEWRDRGPLRENDQRS
jgi:hypothetical protein